MDGLRADPPASFGNYEVTAMRDYEKDVIKDLRTGEERKTGLPASNVLYFELTSDAWLCVRPSGTEPKIKIYFGVVGDNMEDAEKKSSELAAVVKDLFAD